jgi:peptidoglycan/xylan/chitin deacetylase (PgdA/CDA1 family)
MFQGKKKALTFSYDDGVTQDIRLIELFNKYNLKATFNLNSGFLGKSGSLVREGVVIHHNKVAPQDVRFVYDGHEVAAHTLTHPVLTKLSDDAEVIRQVEQDRLNLSELAGCEVVGMAYPGDGTPNICNHRIAGLIRENTGIRYARTVQTTKSFAPFGNLMQYQGTLYHHENWNDLFEMGQRFVDLETDTPQVFYIWGHSYEFDIYPQRWEIFEEFCRMISGHSDIFYGTNREILLGEE